MNNADKFKQIFGLYATELWAMSEEDFLTWLNAERDVPDTNVDNTDRLRELPTIDAVPVVRCKDCRHANECHKSVQYTRNEPNSVTIGYSPIEWCSKGKRRADETD